MLISITLQNAAVDCAPTLDFDRVYVGNRCWFSYHYRRGEFVPFDPQILSLSGNDGKFFTANRSIMDGYRADLIFVLSKKERSICVSLVFSYTSL